MLRFLLLYMLFNSTISNGQKDSLYIDTLLSQDGLWKSYGHQYGTKRIGVWCYVNETENELWKYVYFDSNRMEVLQYDSENLLVNSFEAISREDGAIYMRDGISIRYKNNKITSVYNYKLGKPEGLCIDYYQNEEIKSIWNYKEGLLNGENLNFYETGQLKSKGFYEFGCRSEVWIEYSSNGKIISKGSYEVFEATETNRILYNITSWGGEYFSVKVGIWSYWNDEGVLKKKEAYEAGQLIE